MTITELNALKEKADRLYEEMHELERPYVKKRDEWCKVYTAHQEGVERNHMYQEIMAKLQS